MSGTNGKNGRSQKAHPSGDPRFKSVDRAIKRHKNQPDALIEVLHTSQEAFGYLEEDLLVYVSRQLNVPLAKVYGVATFYHFFSFEPLGDHTCVVCMGTACYVKNAAQVVAAVQNDFGIEPGQTTPDNKLSLSTARCLGSCGLAPVLVLDGGVVGRQTPESALELVRELVAAD